MADLLEEKPVEETSEDQAATPRRQMSAADALEKIRRGELIENVRIERLVLIGEFTAPVRLLNVCLVRPCFESCTFREPVSMKRCVLDRPHFNKNSVFTKGLELREATFCRAHFRNLTVQGPFDCDHVQTRGKLIVAHCRFEGLVRFWEAQFKGWVDFGHCEFLELADLRSFHAEQGINFNKCRFAKDAWFRGASLAKKWDGDESRFEGLLDFSKAKLHDFVYLESIEQGDGQRFAFLNAVGDKILVRTEQLEGRLASECQGDFDTAMHEYGYLKRAFNSLQRYEQEDWAFYHFKVNERRAVGRSWSRPLTKMGQFCSWLFLDLGCGYGTSPRRAVRAAGCIIVFFALIYMIGIEDFGAIKPPMGEPRDSWPNRIVFGLVCSVAVFSSGLSSLKDLAQGWLTIPLLVEALLGTLLWGLFIVAFSRKVIR